MSLSSKFDRSWKLFRASLGVVRSNRKLLLFPALAAAFSIVIVLFFAAPVLLVPTGFAWTSDQHWKAILLRIGTPTTNWQGKETLAFHDTTYGYLAIVYLASMFCATFFNVAFYSEIMKALTGQAVSVRAGLRFALSRVRSILFWSLFAGAVGLVIKALERRMGWLGRIIMRFVGLAWSIASVFVIPVMVQNENAGPVELLRESAAILKRTWGEALIGYVGIAFGSLVLLVVTLVWLGGGIAASLVFNHPLMIVFFVAVWFVAVVAFNYVLGVTNNIFRCALYLYATTGALPAPFSTDMAEGAWKFKKAKA